MKKLFIVLLLSLPTSIFSQGNFTTEWQSPAGWGFRELSKLKVNSDTMYVILENSTSFGNYRVYKSTTDTIAYSFNSSISYSGIYSIRGQDIVQVNKFDVNGDGINEIIGYFSGVSTVTTIVNPVNGSILFQIPGEFVHLVDIDADGYVELITTSSGRATVTSTPAQTVSVNNQNEIVKNYELKQNYPNPFNPTTTIEYSLNKNSDVKIIIYDMLGKEVNTLVNQKQVSGTYKLNLNASALSSGTYFYSLIVDGLVDSKKMILIK